MVDATEISKNQTVPLISLFKAKADVLCRPYTAESVVAKRGSIKIEYASNTQAKKLFALLEEHAKVAHPPILKC
jgi:isocitrate lyase